MPKFITFDEDTVAISAIRSIKHDEDREVSIVTFTDGTTAEYRDGLSGGTAIALSRIVVPAAPGWVLAEMYFWEDGLELARTTVIAFGLFPSGYDFPTPYTASSFRSPFSRYWALIDPATGFFHATDQQLYRSEEEFRAAMIEQHRKDELFPSDTGEEPDVGNGPMKVTANPPFPISK